MSSEIYIAHIGTGTLVHLDEAVLVDLGDEEVSDEPTPDELRARVIAGTPLSTLVGKAHPGLEV